MCDTNVINKTHFYYIFKLLQKHRMERTGKEWERKIKKTQIHWANTNKGPIYIFMKKRAEKENKPDIATGHIRIYYMQYRRCVCVFMFELCILWSNENCNLLSGSSQFLFLLSLPKQKHSHPHRTSFNAHVVANSAGFKLFIALQIVFSIFGCSFIRRFFFLLFGRRKYMNVSIQKKCTNKKQNVQKKNSIQIRYLLWTK